MSSRTTVACYYFPNYHVDPRNEAVHGPGWTEWELVKRAEPRFPGHRQPRLPTWGALDESAPVVMAAKIDAAADHAVDVFLYDWYWYDNGPFLERGLERGFLQAANNARMRFALMWANHDWVDIHPAKLSGLGQHARLLYPGAVTRETLDTIADVVVERYFRHPTYWLVDGCPYFSVYDLAKLMEGLGGLEATRDALASFRAKVRAAGFPDLHLNAVVWSVRILPGETAIASPNELLSALGFDSITSYVWIHHVPLQGREAVSSLQVEYESVRDQYMAYWEETEKRFSLPYFPNVTMGWDSSPRTVQSDVYVPAGYPFTPILAGNTPERFQAALAEAKARLERLPAGHPRVLTINAWNEWTEGSYLEPDTETGMAYLQAIRAVFGV